MPPNSSEKIDHFDPQTLLPHNIPKHYAKYILDTPYCLTHESTSTHAFKPFFHLDSAL